MRVLYRIDDLRGRLDEIQRLAKRLERDFDPILDRHPVRLADGYPRDTSADKGRRGSGHADPTGTVALYAVDTRGSQVERLFAHVHAAARELELADSDRAAVLPPEKTADPSIWCESCFRLEVRDHRGKRWRWLQEVVTHSETGKPKLTRGRRLCRWCAGFYLDYGVLPPVEILGRRQQGKRVYDRDIRDALGESATARG